MALSLYRKYRPNVFSDVVGQEHVEKTLVNAVIEGTVAHAYLFCGPRGTGKTTTARLLAKALLCEKGPNAEPDGTCQQCEEIARGTHPDVYELDAASRTGVDNVRDEIISRVNFAPTRGRYKIYIIDEVHMLSVAAFNALLKTLEEPPEHIVFVLCTTDPHKVPETIQSRCQRFDFRRFSIDEIVGYLERICAGEGFEYEREALEYIAAKSAGGMRDATTALEQVAVYTDGKITLAQTTGLFGQLDVSGLFEIGALVARRDMGGCFTWVNGLVNTGIDLSQFAREFATHIRNLYVTLLTGGGDGIVACTAAELEHYRQQAREFGTLERLSHALIVCGDLVNELRGSSDARLSVEVALTKLCRPQSDLTLEALDERLSMLERAGTGAGAPGGVRADDPWASPAAPHEPVVREQPQAQPHFEPEPYAEAARGREPLSHEDQFMPVNEAQGFDARSGATPVSTPAQMAESAQGVPEPQTQQPREAQPRAEQPARQPAQQPAQQGGVPQMSPARLLAALLTVIRREDMATGALLSGVTLQQEGETYYLTFPSNGGFSMKMACGGPARSLISNAFKEVLGTTVHFECRLDTRGKVRREEFQYETASDAGFAQASSAPSYDDAPAYEEPVYDEAYLASFDEPNFDAPAGDVHVKRIDDDTAADLADVLSAFGKGVKVQEVDDDNQ